MEKVILEAQTRVADGSRPARRIRRAGSVPAIVYGHGLKPLPIQVGARELLKALHTKAGENVIIDLDLKGQTLKEKTCLIKDLQHNPVTDEIAHVDFAIISMTDKITVKVPLVATQVEDAEGVKMGGVLDVVHHEVDVECLPAAIPQKIEVSVKALKMGESIHAKELKLPEGVTLKMDADEVVLAIHAPRAEEVAAPAEGAEAAQPEVIEKGKKDEEKAEGQAPAKPA